MATNVQSIVPDAASAASLPKQPSQAAERWRAFCRRRAALVALVILAAIVLACIAAPWLSPYDPYAGNVKERLLPVGSAGHLLGTDEQGRDLLTRILYGGG